MRATASAAASGSVLREDRVRTVDQDRRLEPAVADLDRDPLRVLEHALGRGGVARQHLGHRVEHGHPDRGLLEAQLGDALARRRELAACELEAAGHRVEHRSEPAHAQGGEAAGDLALEPTHSRIASETGTALTTSAHAM